MPTVQLPGVVAAVIGLAGASSGRRSRAIMLAGLVIAGCGDERQGRDPAATPSSGESAEAELREIFDGYYDALDARDWDAMCRMVAPEVTVAARHDLRVLDDDPNPPRACPEVFEQLYDDEELMEEVVGEMTETAEPDAHGRLVNGVFALAQPGRSAGCPSEAARARRRCTATVDR